MRAVRVPEPGAGFEVVERERPEPGVGEVRLEVAACGVCGGDRAVTEGRPAVDYPRVPGHEVAGRVEAVGDDVDGWAPGDRAAVGWHGGHCFTCGPCRRGAFVHCENEHVTGVLGDGGYAEFVTAPGEALVPVPESLDATAAAPLVCAGLTAYGALRHAAAGAGDLVAVQGVGGVGHLGVRFAAAMGFETVAVSRGTEKREAAVELGADHYVDAEAADPAATLRELGGADAALATAPSADAMAAVLEGLAPDGQLLAVGAPDDPVPFDVARMLGNRWSVEGWSAGHAGDAADALEAAVTTGVEPRVETYPLTAAERAFDRMRSGAVRFRAVLEP
jgi:NADPH2:quinone reductase